MHKKKPFEAYDGQKLVCSYFRVFASVLAMRVKSNVLELRLLNWGFEAKTVEKSIRHNTQLVQQLTKVKLFKQKFLLVYIGSKSDLENNRVSFFIEYSSTLESKSLAGLH